MSTVITPIRLTINPEPETPGLFRAWANDKYQKRSFGMAGAIHSMLSMMHQNSQNLRKDLIVHNGALKA